MSRQSLLAAGDVCLLAGMNGEPDRVVLVLDAAEGKATTLVLDGRVASEEAGGVAWLKGLTRFLRPL